MESDTNVLLQSKPIMMEVDQDMSLEIDTDGSVINDYSITEKCLNWQNNLTNSESLQVLGKQPVILPTTSEMLDNISMYTPGESVDNAHCLPYYQHNLSEQFIVGESEALAKTTNETDEASNFSSQDKLDQSNHCYSSDVLSCCNSQKPMLSDETSTRIRRDSEESQESMDTSSSLASSPYAYSFGQRYAETVSSINSGDNFIQECLSEDEYGHSLNDLKGTKSEDRCAISHDNTPEKATLMPSIEIESDKIPVSRSEPFSSHIEVADPEYAKNPPVVTDNIIVVEDESFLYHSQQSLEQSPTDEVSPTGFLFRASTLPDLQAYERHHNEYGMSWAYQDTRIFLSDGMLQRSMCSFTNADSLFLNIVSENEFDSRHEPNGKRPSTRQLIDIEGNPIKIVPSSDHTTVMILLSLCLGILFIGTDAIRNLQTSLHTKDGLGLTSLVLVFAGYTLGSFMSTPLLQYAQPRVCLIISIVPNILFLLANLSSTLWLLAPISFLQGFSMAVTWSVLNTYITYLATGCAFSTGENIKVVCSRFFNYFSLIYQCSLVIGNLASSILLKYGNNMHSINSRFFSSQLPAEVAKGDASTSSSHFLTKIFSSTNSSFATYINTSAAGTMRDNLFSICGANYQSPDHVIDAGDPWLHPNDGTIYMLHGTFIGCTLVSLAMAVFGIEPLNVNLSTSSVQLGSWQTKSLCGTMTKSFKGIIQGCLAVKFVLLLPLFMYSIMQFGFISAEVTLAFITCPLGIEQIGFSMVIFALGRFPTSFFCGFLTKKCGRLPLITLGRSGVLPCDGHTMFFKIEECWWKRHSIPKEGLHLVVVRIVFGSPLLMVHMLLASYKSMTGPQAASINLISLIILAQWQPAATDIYLIYTMMFCWGLSDGIWISQVNGLISSVFKPHYEGAVGGMRVAQGLGVTIFLSISKFVDMKIKVLVMMAVCLLALTGYLLLRVCLYCENQYTERHQRKAYQIYTHPVKEEI